MIDAFISLRGSQLWREIKEIGFFRILILGGLIGFLFFILFKQTDVFPNVYSVLSIYLLFILLIQLIRQDKLFLKTHFRQYKLICLSEYVILSLPLFVCLIYHAHWLLTLVVFLSLVIIINLNFKFKRRDRNTKIQQFIPDDSFEWKAGLRKYILFILPFWLISLGTSFFIGSVPTAIFILGIIPLFFYEKSEPYQMILAYELSSIRFLWRKISLQLVLFSMICIPLIIAFIFFHVENWYVPIVEYLIFTSVHIYFILTKYAFYKPNSKSASTVIYGSIGGIAILIPFLLPVVWLLSVWFYFKSKNKLNVYLNDYN